MKGKLYSKLDLGLAVVGLVLFVLCYFVGLMHIVARGNELSTWWLPLALFGSAILVNLPRCVILLIVGGPKRWIETMAKEPGTNGASTGVGLAGLYIAAQIATGHIEILKNSVYIYWSTAALVVGGIALGIVFWGVLRLIRRRFMSYRRGNGTFIQLTSDGSVRSGNPLWGKDANWCKIPDVTSNRGKDPWFIVTVNIPSEGGVVTPVTLKVGLPSWYLLADDVPFDFERLRQLGVTKYDGIEAWLQATVLAKVAANRVTLEPLIRGHHETGRPNKLEIALGEVLNQLQRSQRLPEEFGPFNIKVEPSYVTTKT